MTERWLGLTVSSDKAVVVDAEIPDDEKAPITILNDFTLSLQKGNRAEAYATLHSELADYCREKSIDRAVVKASAISLQGRPALSHLHSAELRGVVIASLQSVCPTEAVAKGNMSRTFGDRKVDEYLADTAFWEENFEGSMRAGSKEAAFCILARSRK